MDEKNETFITVVPETPSKLKRFGAWAKANAVMVGIGLAGVALSAYQTYDTVKRNKKQAAAYVDFLDTSLEIRREGLEAYKAGLPPTVTETV